MGREIKRVPLDFSFPPGESYADDVSRRHRVACSDPRCEFDCEVAIDPPAGEGWQLWQTVSGGPTSPVFRTQQELIEWMMQPCKRREERKAQGTWMLPMAQGWTADEVAYLLKNTSGPSFVLNVIAPTDEAHKKSTGS